MKYKEVIQDAWSMTQENKQYIWWFGFPAAFLASITSIIYLVYQVDAFWNNSAFRAAANDRPFFKQLREWGLEFFVENTGLAAGALILLGIFAIIYMFLPVFTQGALIQILAKRRAGHPVRVVEGISFGFTRFLQLFEYQAFIKFFSAVTILSFGTMLVRYLGPGSIGFMLMIGGFLLLLAAFFTLLFTYAEYFLVIDREGVFKSITKSSGLVIRHWHHTLFMLLLMIMISVRIIINALIALAVPALVIIPVFLFASLTLAIIGAVIGGIIGFIGLVFGAYFLGIFDVFATAVWTFTFLELTMTDDFENLRSDIQAAQVQKEVENSESESTD